MRAGIVRVALTTAAIALLLLGIPLALAIRTVVYDQARADLTSQAQVAAARIGPDFAAGDPVELPAPPADVDSGVYDTHLALRAGRGPVPADPVTGSALSGSIATGEALEQLVVAVPVSQDEQIIGVARAATRVSALTGRVAAWSAALIGAAAVSLVVALLVARRLANRLSKPLADLAAVSDRLRSGDLAARAEPSGIAELDAVVTAQNASADTITTLLDSERRYASQVSHQLRTPLARMALMLEANQARNELGTVADTLHAEVAQLTATVEGLLAFARQPDRTIFAAPTADLGDLIEKLRAAWHGPLAAQGRRIQTRVPADLSGTRVRAGLAEQILGILLSNAATHGSGTVAVDVRDLGGAIAVDVADEGSMPVPQSDMFTQDHLDRPHGIGLPLARSLAQAHGGRLELSGTQPTRFTWLLVPEDDADHSDGETRVASVTDGDHHSQRATPTHP